MYWKRVQRSSLGHQVRQVRGEREEAREVMIAAWITTAVQALHHEKGKVRHERERCWMRAMHFEEGTDKKRRKRKRERLT